MNARDQGIVAAIRAAAEAGHRCPSNAELAARFGFGGKQGVVEALKRLERDGHIVVTRGAVSRVVAAPDGSWRTAGDVGAAFWASPAVVGPDARGGPWSDATKARLRDLWMQTEPCLSTAEIGARMGMSKNAVVGKARRLK